MEVEEPLCDMHERLQAIRHPQLQEKVRKVISSEYSRAKRDVLQIVKDAIRQELRNALTYTENLKPSTEFSVYIPID